MMIRRILLAGCMLAAPTAAGAQQSHGPSVEGSIGLLTGGGGTFHRRTGPAVDGVLAVPVARTPAGTVMVGLTGGISGPVAHDLICRQGPDDSCIPDYPTFATIGGAAGVQRALGPTLSIRALAGAALYQDVEEPGPASFGFQGRVDMAQRLVFRTALVASVRGALLPSHEGASLSMAAFGIGLRIQ